MSPRQLLVICALCSGCLVKCTRPWFPVTTVNIKYLPLVSKIHLFPLLSQTFWDLPSFIPKDIWLAPSVSFYLIQLSLCLLSYCILISDFPFNHDHFCLQTTDYSTWQNTLKQNGKRTQNPTTWTTAGLRDNPACVCGISTQQSQVTLPPLFNFITAIL